MWGFDRWNGRWERLREALRLCLWSWSLLWKIGCRLLTLLIAGGGRISRHRKLASFQGAEGSLTGWNVSGEGTDLWMMALSSAAKVSLWTTNAAHGAERTEEELVLAYRACSLTDLSLGYEAFLLNPLTTFTESITPLCFSASARIQSYGFSFQQGLQNQTKSEGRLLFGSGCL